MNLIGTSPNIDGEKHSSFLNNFAVSTLWKVFTQKKKLNQESMFHEDVEDKVTLKPTDYD